MQGPGTETAHVEMGLARTSSGKSIWLGEASRITLPLKAQRRAWSRYGSHGEPLRVLEQRRDGMTAICLSGSIGQDRPEEGTVAGKEAIHSSAGWLTL